MTDDTKTGTPNGAGGNPGPVRQSLTRIETPDLMGEGSYVVLRNMTWGRLLDFRRRFDKVKDKEALTLESEEQLIGELLAESVHDWNWVDEDGKRLPLPKDTDKDKNPDAPSLELMANEVTFLVEAIMQRVGEKAARKN